MNFSVTFRNFINSIFPYSFLLSGCHIKDTKRFIKSKINSLHYLSYIALSILSNCKVDELIYEPKTTPEAWLQMRPSIQMGELIFNEPLGSFLVFLLAFLWIFSGFYFLKNQNGEASRKWFGIALVLGGIGAAQAGISYQAFSYMLKCKGHEFCHLTNGFEIGYSVTQAVSVSCMLASVALACTTGILRNSIIGYCILNAIVYIIITIMGISKPDKLLLSFEVLMLFAVPGLLFVLIISGISYIKTRSALDGSLVMAAVLQVLVQASYFAYYLTGITAALYKNGEGFYFSENDVLHVGMIFWLWYIVVFVGKHLKDYENSRSHS